MDSDVDADLVAIGRFISHITKIGRPLRIADADGSFKTGRIGNPLTNHPSLTVDVNRVRQLQNGMFTSRYIENLLNLASTLRQMPVSLPVPIPNEAAIRRLTKDNLPQVISLSKRGVKPWWQL